jgi:predicted flap endonuclease-1-like 5' DNA nuclease
MSPDLAAKLRERGIHNSDQFLAAAATPAGRRTLAEDLGATPEAILELANRADLARIRGIAGIFGDLLENAGVDTVKELATRNPDNLYAALVKTNEASAIAGRHAYKKEVQDWISQARALPRTLEY